jgi:uncharacterized membrane protein
MMVDLSWEALLSNESKAKLLYVNGVSVGLSVRRSVDLSVRR